GFFIAADALLIAYGLSQRKAGIILMATLTVIGMFVALWRGVWIMVPGGVCRNTRGTRLLPGQATLANANMTLRMRAEYEKLDAAMGEDGRRREGWKIAANCLGSGILISLITMLLFQVGLFALALIVANYTFF